MTSVFGRIEYGKLCVTIDGPICSRAESGVLAATPGFPDSMRPYCTPRLVGPNDDIERIEAAEHFGSTLVVVPVFSGGCLARLGARWRRRPEQGEGHSGRTFWRAVFLTDGGLGTNLATLGGALASLSISGWTASDRCDAIPSNAALGAALPRWPGLEQWLDTAARFICLGVPVGMVEGLAAAPFFALAWLLTERLPRKLQRIFSAGWGVPVGHTAAFGVSVAREFSPGVAVYDGALRNWSHRPEDSELLLREQTVTSHRSSGRGAMEGSEGVVWFDREESRHVVQQVFGESADDATLSALQLWLAGDGEEERPQSHPGRMRSARARVRYVDELLAALSHDPPSPRAEAIVVELLREPERQLLLERATSTVTAALIDLLRTLVDEDLDALPLKLDGRVGPLPPWSSVRVRELLSASLVPVIEARVARHARAIIGIDDCHSAYREWALSDPDSLALLIARAAPLHLRSAALEVLAARSGSPGVGLVLEVASGGVVAQDEAERRVAAAPAWRAVLARIAGRRWKEARTADERAASLVWLRALAAEPDHPLLRRGAPQAGEVESLTSALAEATVPPPLLNRLASRVLTQWPHFRQHVGAERMAWIGVLARWPPAAVTLLVPGIAPSEWEPITPEVEVALQSLVVDPSELESIGAAAARAGVLEGRDQEAVARLFIDWCGRCGSDGLQHPLVDAVSALWHGTPMPATSPNVAVEAILALLRQQQSPPVAVVWEAWTRAATADWLLLLLRLFGPLD